MPSTRQFKKAAKKEPTGSVGIAVHTSEPLYGKNKPNSNEHEHHLPPVEALAVNNNGYQPAQVDQGYYNPDSQHHSYDHSQGHQAEAHQHSYHQAQNIYSPQQSTHAHDHHPSHDHAHVHQDHSHDHGHVHHDHSHDHGHVHHDHSHDHRHVHQDHHDHAHAHHDHSHHDHAHHHNFSPVYIPPLPSWAQIFSTLIPEQKTIFTWFMIHLGIGFWLYCLGTSRECLSLVGFAYLMIFDALGVLNTFVSSILRTQPAFTTSNTKRPYGAHRYEIVFALGTTIYLLFATMNNTKESLEHFLLQDQHHLGEPHHDEGSANTFSFGIFLLIGAAISATCLSTISLRNHESFVRYLRKRPTTVQGFTYNVVNRARASPLSALSSNIYSLSIVLCGITILVCYLFGILTPFIDKAVALSESCVMFYLGYPTASALAKVLLQTTPRSIQNSVENRLREIQQQEVNIISMDRIHFWQTTYGKCVGTIEVRVQPEADEQAILELIYQKLEGLTNNTADSSQSELTVSIIKH
ncbi:hypothetical protein G6F56_006816 [Rhizopus delemar]|uniref:Cation efflux protein transmembrane domain-containing protein n=1 Tax=Rhizopus stolonifer TaxID=4846 RepID=A0A367KKV2_RHIST|nr:hypothetical protein G6F56_006816 [Rhizopus delemar]RCI02863.1 hypothetical protein CU098_005252 [Rhizopus stolonifer]